MKKETIKWAVKTGNIRALKMLQKIGVDLYPYTEELLNIAIKYGRMKVVKLLLLERVRLKASSYLLEAAVELGYENTVKFLLKKCKFDRDEIAAALTCAADAGNIKLTSLLIEMTDEIYNALIYTSERGNIEVIKILFKKKINKLLINDAVMTAAFYEQKEVVEYLINHGAQLPEDWD